MMIHERVMSGPAAGAKKLAVVVFLGLLAACPSEPNEVQEAPGLIPESNGIAPSMVDEVEVVSPEEALQRADDEIDESNVLDALKALESEVE
jgi:hypothetical protein